MSSLSSPNSRHARRTVMGPPARACSRRAHPMHRCQCSCVQPRRCIRGVGPSSFCMRSCFTRAAARPRRPKLPAAGFAAGGAHTRTEDMRRYEELSCGCAMACCRCDGERGEHHSAPTTGLLTARSVQSLHHSRAPAEFVRASTTVTTRCSGILENDPQ